MNASDALYDIQYEKYRQLYDVYESQRRARRYMYNHKRHEEQKVVDNAIKRMRVEEPKKWTELMYKVEHAAEFEAEKREKQRLEQEEQHRLVEQRQFKFRHGLVAAGIPNIDFSGVEGMIAFRTWNVKPHVRTDEGGLFLGSTAMNTSWKPVMIADRIPAEGNDNGLYCVRLDPLGLMTRASYYLGEVCGLLELRGKVLEHTDGVVKAEWARIICVFIQANEKAENVYSGLSKSYPTVPMYILHKEQIAEILLRVTVMQSMREMR